jgi:hypothetical protein
LVVGLGGEMVEHAKLLLSRDHMGARCVQDEKRESGKGRGCSWGRDEGLCAQPCWR